MQTERGIPKLHFFRFQPTLQSSDESYIWACNFWGLRISQKIGIFWLKYEVWARHFEKGLSMGTTQARSGFVFLRLVPSLQERVNVYCLLALFFLMS